MRITKNEQRSLSTLSSVDEKIRRLKHIKTNLPEQLRLDELTENFDNLMIELAETVSELEKLEKNNRRLENEITTVVSSQKAADAQLYSGSLTNEKQVEAVRQEIGAMKTRRSELEDTQLEVMEQLEGLTAKSEELKSKKLVFDKEIEEASKLRDDAAVEVDQDLADCNSQRERLTTDISDDILSIYNRVSKSHVGPAVASLQGRTCQGCHMELPAIDVEEINDGLRAGELVSCPECETILVSLPD